MLLALADAFRCPAEHEESALVLSVDSWLGQRVARGLLGCPVCQARYPIVDGVVDFQSSGPGAALATVDDVPMPDESGRVQAQLNLSEPGGVVLLAGRYAMLGPVLADQMDVVCLLVDASSTNQHCVGVTLGDRIPLAAGSLRAAAIEGGHATPPVLQELVRVIRGGGRLLAGSGAEPPEGLQILAKDPNEWVGQVEERPTVIPLRRPAR